MINEIDIVTLSIIVVSLFILLFVVFGVIHTRVKLKRQMKKLDDLEKEHVDIGWGFGAYSKSSGKKVK